MEPKKQNWHLITEQEYYQIATGTLPPGIRLSKEETMLEYLKRTGKYEKIPSVTQKNDSQE